MRRLAGCLSLLLTLLVAVAPVAGESAIDWTLGIQPNVVPAGVFTTFTLTATNHGDGEKLGCLEVTLPASFTIQSVGDPQASNGRDWVASLGGTTNVVHSVDGGGKLDEGEFVTFTVRARPNSSGQTAWANHAHKSQHCEDVDQPGLPVVVTVTQGAATPTPVPTPTSPAPTPVPTATPRPTPPPHPTPPTAPPGTTPPGQGSSTPQPSTGATTAPSSPSPAAAGDDRTPAASARASDDGSGTGSTFSGTDDPTGGPSGNRTTGQSGTTGGVSTGDGSPAFALIPEVAAPSSGVIGLGFEVFDLLDGTHVWFVPAMTVGVPGLLVILWVALQTVGILAWLPAVRRMRGGHRSAVAGSGS